jgi:prepilin-type N-terminal cleavage/methylation domain-containing protein
VVNLKSESGFTITEVVIAVIVLSVGLLGLASTGALTTRMIGRGQRSAVAATFAARRLELLRPAACIPAQRVNGSEILYRGSTAVATNVWTFTLSTNQTVQVRVFTTYTTAKNKTRAETTETSVSCLV